METETIEAPVDLATEEAAALAIRERIDAIQITDRPSYEASLAITAEAKGRIGAIKNRLAQIKKSAHEAWKGIVKLESDGCAYYEAIIEAVTPRQKEYLRIEDDRRREEERVANELAEKERRRLADLAAENERKAAEARAAGDEKKAEKLEAKAEAQEERAATVPTYVPPPRRRSQERRPRRFGSLPVRTWRRCFCAP